MPGPDDSRQVVRTMPRYIAIDGLRAWLAWIVVATHIVQQALPDAGGADWVRMDLGGEAVSTFIIISGFVISHLLIERPTRYLPYIVPRFMRLFPAFSVCCLIGGLAYAASARWSDPTWFEMNHAALFDETVEYLPQHIIAHLTMLHGVLPNTVLPLSEYVFSPPGWSVSLEWQFYLVAPLVIRMCRHRRGATILVVAVALLSLWYHEALKPLWDRPSMLAGSAKFFLIGIASRFAAPALAGSVSYIAAVGLGLGFSLLWIGSPAIALWIVVYSFMMRHETPSGATDRIYTGVMRAALESRAAQFLADRSYSTYLLHWSVIMVIGLFATRWGVDASWSLLAWMTAAIPLTLVLQEPIYRYVELPGRSLGRKWARRLGGAPVKEIPKKIITAQST
ncbi:acyltransferase [Sphingomonas bacterium]|uniref:acyltransferase family protein n=1 Tax=Sphingomonas bacterium TaxID=1895847 RepID=UPI001576378B|nr:acyltransferase [Sphingomonas bacterium]